MFNNPVAQTIAVVIVLTAIYAAWKGDRAERWGGLMNLAAFIAVFVIHSMNLPNPSTPLLLADGGLALGFLVLAVRYASFWLGGAMILQGVQFSLHAYYLIGEVPHDMFYARVNNADTFGILLFIIVGATMSWRKRQRRAREEAAKAQG